jgi:DNA-binding NarL/FixJ family response regulator
VARAEPGPELVRLGKLTPRELEVLSHMAQGASNAGIANALSVSEHSVENHVSSILAKLGVTAAPHVHRRVKAVLFYLAATSAILQDRIL